MLMSCVSIEEEDAKEKWGDFTREDLYEGPGAPLPEEISNMSREETVCRFFFSFCFFILLCLMPKLTTHRFCGISYLVFSEIKALETRLAQTERALAEHEVDSFFFFSFFYHSIDFLLAGKEVLL